MSVPIVLDCDPGQDDAIAILVAARYGELVAITTVNGNVGLDLTTRNALVTAQIAGLDVPVHAGAARPLVAEPQHAEHVHGSSGLDGPRLPPVERRPAGHDAVGELIALSHRVDGLWVVATGPLTNVALAIHRDPGFVHRIAGLAVMGGAAGVGNVTAAAEFNAWADPEAAAIVHASGARPVMLGLNLTHQVCMGRAEVEALRAAGTETAAFCADLLAYYCTTRADDGPVHDPCAVLAVTHPDLFQTIARPVRVELAGVETRGMTVVDERSFSTAEPTTEVAYSVDADAAKRLILDAVIGD